MTKNPAFNALAALAYITLVSSIMFYLNHNHANEPDTIFAPIAFLSLFTLSAGVMGYIFLSSPVQLYLDGDKSGALHLFVKTLLTFAALTLIIFFFLLRF